jgi:PadR family transcriptional regulator
MGKSIKAVAPGIKRGSAELAILAVLADGPLHGYEIARRIEHRTEGVLGFDVASLYPLLYRFEKRGWVRASWESAPSGRKRRYYRLTPAGKKQLAPLRRQWRLFFQALDRLAGVADA